MLSSLIFKLLSIVFCLTFLLFNATVFNQPLNNWDTSNVTEMREMFKKAAAFNQPIGNWDVSSVTNMYQMFAEASSFNQDLNNWNVSSVNDMEYLFIHTPNYQHTLSCWDFQPGVKIDRMFWYSGGEFLYHYVKRSDFDPGNWMPNSQNKNSTCSDCGLTCTGDEVVTHNGTCYVCAHPSDRTFTSKSTLEDAIDACAANNWGTDDCIINMWDVSQVTDMSSLFSNKNTFNEDISSWDVSSVTTMKMMFFKCHNFNQPIGSWDVSNVTDMTLMFYQARAFNQPLNSWDTSSVTNMRDLFEHTDVFNQPLDNWDTTSVENMHRMFAYAYVFNQPLNNWDVSTVTDMKNMFVGSGFNQPLHTWNVSSVTKMDSMFYATTFNHTLSCWDFSNNPSITNIMHLAPAKDLTHYVKTGSFNPSTGDIPNQGDKDDPNSDCPPCAAGFVRFPDSMDCIIPCPAGEDPSTGSCQPCAAGKYRASNMGLCAANTDFTKEINGDQTGLVDCAAGKSSYDTSGGTSGVTCVPCLAGSYRTSNMPSCDVNNDFTKRINDNRDGLVDCAAGEVSTLTNAATCQPCPENTYRASNMPSCAACDTAGETSPPGSAACYTFSNLPDQALLDEWQRRHGTCGSS